MQRVFIPSLPHGAMFEFVGLFLSTRITQAKQDKSLKKGLNFNKTCQIGTGIGITLRYYITHRAELFTGILN